MGIAKTVGLALIVVGIILVILSFVPIQQTIYEETFVVPPLSYRYICTTFGRPVELTIEVRVLQGGYRDINFWVMPAREFFLYINGSGAPRYYTIPSRQMVTDTSISWSPPVGERICFVYDNTFSIITSKTVYSKIAATYLSPTIELLLPGIVLLIVGAIIAVRRVDKKNDSPWQYPTGYTP